MSNSSNVRPGTTFKLKEDLRVDSATRSFGAFQNGSNHSAMHAKHLANFQRPEKDGLPMQGPLTRETYNNMSEQVRQHRVQHDDNFSASGTNTVMITDQSSVSMTQPNAGNGLSAKSAKKRLDVGSGRGVVVTSTPAATAIDSGKSKLRVLSSNMHLESSV